MIESSALMASPVSATPTCQECPALLCDFRVSRVRFFLTVYRQARLLREPFDVVLRYRSRNSRSIDPAVRGKGFDVERARAIGWSLDEIRRTHGDRFMHSANAEAVARLLCPERYQEGAVDSNATEAPQ